MTQDCSDSPSAAGAGPSLPKGINIIGTEQFSGPKREGIPLRKLPHKKEDPAAMPSSWSYLLLPRMVAKSFCKWLDAHNADAGNTEKQPYFIHQTLRYVSKDREKNQGVKKVLEPSVSGLVFLQGTVRGIQQFLAMYFPQFHLVNDRCYHRPASIKDSIMQPFMNVMQNHPEQVTFLKDSFESFARDHVKLRLLTGPFQGYEGYIVRIDRDRQLVFDFGGYAVAIRGVHKEDFEIADSPADEAAE